MSKVDAAKITLASPTFVRWISQFGLKTDPFASSAPCQARRWTVLTYALWNSNAQVTVGRTEFEHSKLFRTAEPTGPNAWPPHTATAGPCAPKSASTSPPGAKTSGCPLMPATTSLPTPSHTTATPSSTIHRAELPCKSATRPWYSPQVPSQSWETFVVAA